MTEEEWLACDNVEEMLSSLGGKASERKVRLFAVACGRSVWHLLPDGWCRNAVKVAERLADGQATEQERASAYGIGLELLGLSDPPNEPLATALGTLEKANPGYDGTTPLFAGAFATASAAAYAFANEGSSSGGQHPPGSPAWRAALVQAERLQLDLLCDIFGPLPFRLVPPSPAWLTWQGGMIPLIAQGIYDDRAFGRMPQLADALEEAGCDNADILGHCRGPGPHCRGCWCIDLLTGRE